MRGDKGQRHGEVCGETGQRHDEVCGETVQRHGEVCGETGQRHGGARGTDLSEDLRVDVLTAVAAQPTQSPEELAAARALLLLALHPRHPALAARLLRPALVLRLLHARRHLARAPGHDVQVAHAVHHQHHVARRDAQEVEGAAQQAQELLRVEHGRDDEDGDEQQQEDGVGGDDGVLGDLHDGADDDGHHEEGVDGAEDGGETELHLGLGHEADDEVEDGGADGEHVALPQRDPHHGVEGTGHHQQDGGGAQDGGDHQHALVAHVQVGDVVVDLDGGAVALQQVHDVGEGGGDPAAALVEELVEAFRGVGHGVGGGAVFHPVSLLQHQRAQPPVLACTHSIAVSDRHWKEELRCQTDTGRKSCGVRHRKEELLWQTATGRRTTMSDKNRKNYNVRQQQEK